MKKCIFSMMMSWVLLAMTMASAFASDGVDWENQKVIVTGMGIAPPTAVNAAQARMLARRAAVVDGYRQMAEQINGVQVDAESTVENMMILSDIVRTKVSACIKGARVLDEQILPDGSYAVRMEVPMFGSSNSLAAAVLQRPAMRQPFPAPSPEEDEDETFPAYTSSVHMDIRIDTNMPDYTGNRSRISYAATNFSNDQIPRIPSYAAVQQPQYSKETSRGKSSRQNEPIMGDYE
ncbi:MAG: LPP20 family lipoprotein [Selenomonadaceae bacterium]|nr:LPP20 family lipoprotein [Selenomonadaceae bacterium]